MTSATDMIDWDLAVKVGSRLAGDGPRVTRDEADAVVAELRGGAERSTGLVREFTGLTAAERTAPILVVDRSAWVQTSADGFATILAPIAEKLSEKKNPGKVTKAIGSRLSGLEVGAVLGFLGGKVLGQFDPFYGRDGVERGTSERPSGESNYGRDGVERGTSERPSGESNAAPGGRLLLVAPNIVHVEREIGADPHDFRLWVCLHEETHRVQFTAVPWMRDHLFAEVEKLADTVSPNTLEEGLSRIVEALKNGRKGLKGGSLLDLVGTPEQKEFVDRVTGMMSLLEGHADVVMDGVGPTVIPSVAEIRKKFNARRGGTNPLDRFVRKLLGMDLKMAQYRDGAKFVRHVVDTAGMEQFNAVWQGPDTLPTKDEIADPATWMARVL